MSSEAKPRGSERPSVPPGWYRPALPPRNRALWASLLVVAAAFFLYRQALGFGFVFDDHSLIGADGPLWVGGNWIPYRPLRHLSFMFDHRLGGGAGWAYHLGNIALHAAAGVLVLRLCLRAGAPVAAALICTLAFVAHPLAVEAVAYVSGRRDVLAALLGLAAVAAWTRTRNGGSTDAAIAIVLALLGVATKEAAALVVPQLFAASLCGLGPSARRAVLPLAITAAAAVALPMAYGARGPLTHDGSLASTLAVAGTVVTHYAARIVKPTDLSVEYPALQCAATDCGAMFGAKGFAVGLLLLVAAGLCVARMVRRGLDAERGTATATAAAPAGAAATTAAVTTAAAARTTSARMPAAVNAAAAWGADWFLFSFVWVASWAVAVAFVIGGHEPGADRHVYPLLAALAVLMATVAQRLRPIVRSMSVVALVLWLVWASGLARDRIGIWRDDLTLWRHEVATAPGSARVHHNLAAELAARGHYGNARHHLRVALTIDPAYWPSELGLAGIDCMRGRTLCAASHVAQAAASGAPSDQIASVQATCARRAAAK